MEAEMQRAYLELVHRHCECALRFRINALDALGRQGQPHARELMTLCLGTFVAAATAASDLVWPPPGKNAAAIGEELRRLLADRGQGSHLQPFAEQFADWEFGDDITRESASTLSLHLGETSPTVRQIEGLRDAAGRAIATFE
jgi:hypothetical protein